MECAMYDVRWAMGDVRCAMGNVRGMRAGEGENPLCC